MNLISRLSYRKFAVLVAMIFFFGSVEHCYGANTPTFCKKLNILSSHASFPKYVLPSGEIQAVPKVVLALDGQYLPARTPPKNPSPEAVILLWVSSPNCGSELFKDNIQSFQFDFLNSHGAWTPLRNIPINPIAIYSQKTEYGPAWTIAWKAGLPVNRFNYDLPEEFVHFRVQSINSTGAGAWSKDFVVPLGQ